MNKYVCPIKGTCWTRPLQFFLWQYQFFIHYLLLLWLGTSSSPPPPLVRLHCSRSRARVSVFMDPIQYVQRTVPWWWWRGEEICIKICHVKFIIVFVDIPFLYPFFEINAIVVIIIIISVTPLFFTCKCYFWPSFHLLVIYLMLWSVVLQLLRFYSLLMDKKQLFIPHFCHSIIIYCVVILSYFIHPLSGAIQDLINVFSFHQHLVLLWGIEKVDSTSSLVLQFNADWFPSIVVVAVARHVESSPSFGSLKLNANLFHRISML